MRRIHLGLFYWLVCGLMISAHVGEGQVFRGSVLEGQKNDPLPYASIGVRGKSIGGIADANGHFNIDLSKAGSTDTVVVSYLGFGSLTFLKSDITTQFYKLRLTPIPYQLNEVKAVGKREILIIGNKEASSNYTGWGDYVSSKGRLRGLAIEPTETPLQLSKFRMRLHHQEFDSVRVRLHLIALNPDHSPAMTSVLLKTNVFFTCARNQKWVEIDMKPYQIVVSGGIVVAVEWVDSWFGARNATGDSKRFTIATSKEEGYAYERKTPEEPFVVSKFDYTPTMYFETFRVANPEKR